MACANNPGVAGRLLVGLFIGGCAAIAAAQPLDRGADALLAIDQHRASVVEHVVDSWGAALAKSSAHVSIDELRMRLQGLRADRLLAVSSPARSRACARSSAQKACQRRPPNPACCRRRRSATVVTMSSYTPVTPCRLVETRGTFAAVYQGNGTPAHTAVPFAPGEIRSYAVKGGNGACLAQLPSTLNPAAVQLQVFGMPTTAASGRHRDPAAGCGIRQHGDDGVHRQHRLQHCIDQREDQSVNNQISVQVRGGGANLAIDVVGYFRRPSNYDGTTVSADRFNRQRGE